MSVRADITITVGGNQVAYLRDANLSIEQEFIPVAAEDVYGWPDVLPGTRSWSAQGSVFIPLIGSDDAIATMKTAMINRTTIACTVDFQGTTETSTAVVSGFSISADVGAALVGSFSLQGTAPL